MLFYLSTSFRRFDNEQKVYVNYLRTEHLIIDRYLRDDNSLNDCGRPIKHHKLKNLEAREYS